jgi:SAM-dependent methyltransferase
LGELAIVSGGMEWLESGEGTERPLRLSSRLRAWWEGYDLSGLVVRPQAVIPPEPPMEHPPIETSLEGELLGRDGNPLWNSARVKIVEQLWGADFTSPGGVEQTIDLVKPFGINSKMSILDLSAGLGGVSRAIAEKYKAWVTGMEPSPFLAELGAERSLKKGLIKLAPITAYDPNNLILEKRYDGIFAKEAFFTVADKQLLFSKIAAALKPEGQFLMTDYGISNADLTNPQLVSWISSEPQEPHLWTMERTLNCLKSLKLDVRTNEDMTDLQRKLILASLGRFTQQLKSHSLDSATKKATIDEIELWARRMSAFDAGLRVFRFYCIKH